MLDSSIFPRTKGIYIIRNLINLKAYIGSSTNLRARIQDHIRNLKQNKHRNKHLQAAVNKYTIDNFCFSILDHYSESPLEDVEQHFIEYFQTTNKRYGYNKTIAGRPPSNKGISKTAEHNRKNSLAKLGSKNPNFGKPASRQWIASLIESNIKRKKSFTLISPEGEEVSFTGLAEFCRKNNLSCSSISLVLSNKQSNHKGWTIPNNTRQIRFRRRH